MNDKNESRTNKKHQKMNMKVNEIKPISIQCVKEVILNESRPFGPYLKYLAKNTETFGWFKVFVFLFVYLLIFSQVLIGSS